MLPAPLLNFDHIGRGKQGVQTLIKETEQEKYSPAGQTLTFQEGCQRQTAVASLFALVRALQQSTKLVFNSISEQKKIIISLEMKRNFLFHRKYHNVFHFDM